MNFLVTLCCIAAVSSGALAGWAGPPANIALTADGRNVLDTPEVAHARAAHLAALAQANAGSGPEHGEDDGSYDPRWDNEETWQQAGASPHYNAQPAWNPAPAWNAAPAHYSAGPAPVADTPEVAQAKAAHFAALAAAGHGAAPAYHAAPAPQWHSAPAAPSWHNAPAPIRLSHDGTQVLETPEVAAARAAHLAAHATAAPDHYSAPAPQHYAAPAHFAPAPQKWAGAPSWHAAPAQIRLSHDGSQVLETPEVAAARAAHLAAHAAAASHSHPAPANKW